MRIISRKTLLSQGKLLGPEALAQAQAWYQEAKNAKWASPKEIVNQYPKASIVNDEVVVFNICGNRFRLVVKIWYEGQEVYIKYFVTHADYNRLNLRSL